MSTNSIFPSNDSIGIQLPDLFNEKLEGHNIEKGLVYSAIASFGQWFETSGTPFFRDYTDHGLKHVSSVLATAAVLIHDDAIEIFTARDTTIFILATLLHDSALHLAEPGFQQLILGGASNRYISEFDKVTWPALWDEYLFSARRWDDRKLANIFGKEFVQHGETVSNPFDRWGNFSQADFKLIGEFIRQHHSRLAHEFAIFGVPGIKPDFLRLPSGTTNDWCDISGIVARSHGIPLRESLDYITKHFHKREYQGIHSIYLMALLRLADYIQIEATRAPEIVFQYRILPSHTSDLEWRTHQSVKNITPEHEDPESVEVYAEPLDVTTYLRLHEWLNGIQNELDTSWAILGEVYGRYLNLKNFGFRWRRIHSNLDDSTSFSKTVPYVPRRIRLEVARAEMLSLLIRPLYGDDPSYGVRELIQNAVDAVREREYFQKRYLRDTDNQLREQAADVVVWLSDFDKRANCAWLEVSDRGIGMTEKILTEYFLIAGASYRHSNEWQQVFERTDLPLDKSKPLSYILRSGHFGIGALATFLLGEEIEVETRHITSSVGFRFKMLLTQEAVQIDLVNDLPVGTCIKAKLNEMTFKKLSNSQEKTFKPESWDWYVLSNPSIMRVMGDERKEMKSKFMIDLNEWKELKTQLPYSVHWTYSNIAPHLSCNGIFISTSDKLPKLLDKNLHSGRLNLNINTPCIHISDPDGRLPLNLTRKELDVEEYGFESFLAEDVVKDFFANFLLIFPETLDVHLILAILEQDTFTLSSSFTDYSYSLPCMLSTDGFCLPIENASAALGKPILHSMFLKGSNAMEFLTCLDAWDCVIVNGSEGFGDFNVYREREGYRLGRKPYDYHLDENRETLITDFRKAMIWSTYYSKEERYNFLEDRITKKSSKSKHDLVQHKLPLGTSKEFRKVWLEETKGLSESAYPFNKLSEEFIEGYKHSKNRNSSFKYYAELLELNFKEPWNPNGQAFGVINEWWQKFFGNELIPWKKADRRAKFPDIYKELEPYFKRYEK